MIFKWMEGPGLEKLEVIPVIETNRFILRGIKMLDAKGLLPILSDAALMRYITPHPLQTQKELETEITEQLTRFKEQKEIPWVIIEKASRETVGTFRFHKLRMWHKSAEMGAVIRKESQRTGVMSELLPKLLDFAFNSLKLNRIVGDCFAENQGSRKLLENFGFTKEGVLRQTDFDGSRFHDTMVFSLLREEYLG